MNDKSIREILISWLQATNHEIRIYQEKSIGASICDVMAVTDKLTGYEIKSDQDNYARLQDQVKAYDRFFDENYLVVSQSHSRSAESKVPCHWGILYIQNDNITVIRRAQKTNRYTTLQAVHKMLGLSEAGTKSLQEANMHSMYFVLLALDELLKDECLYTLDKLGQYIEIDDKCVAERIDGQPIKQKTLFMVEVHERISDMRLKVQEIKGGSDNGQH